MRKIYIVGFIFLTLHLSNGLAAGNEKGKAQHTTEVSKADTSGLAHESLVEESLADKVMHFFSDELVKPNEMQMKREVPSSSNEIQLSYAPVVDKVVPAVVNIYASKVVHQQFVSPLFMDDFFRNFFGMDDEEFAMPDRVQQSLGSGVIVRKDGLIITNLHVIEGASEIKIQTSDHKEYLAHVVVRDPKTDLAALKIDLSEDSKGVEFPYLKLRDADSLKVGDLVLAVGNPFGLGSSVTNGIISGLSRTQPGVADYRSFIQTDATINPGNSGGALVTLDGRLIGINTAIISKSGGSVGVNFAIPSNLVAPVIASADQKNADGVVRPWVGIALQSIDEDMANSLKLDRKIGILVKAVYPGGPAEKAGIKVGDVIMEVDGHEILNKSTYFFRIAIRPSGYEMPFVINRDGTKKTVMVTLVTPPTSSEKPIALKGRHILSGATVAQLSPGLATELGLNDMEKGVVIMSVGRNSIAARSGLLRGDVIQEVNFVPITSASQLNSLITKHVRGQDGRMEIKIKRGENVMELTVSLG